MIESRIKVDEDAVKAFNEEQVWYGYDRTGRRVEGKLRELRNYGKQGKSDAANVSPCGTDEFLSD